MRKLITLLLVFIVSVPVFSQDVKNLLFEEQFSDNSNEWIVGSNEERDLDIFDGVYRIYVKRSDLIYRTINTLEKTTYLNEYKVEARLKQKNGEPEDPFGIIWQGNDINNFCAFEINASGEFYIWYYKNGEYNKIVDGSHTYSIFPQGQYNKLAVVKKGQDVYFFINDRLVYREKAKTFTVCGNYVGFVTEGKMEILVDYIKIYGKKKELKIVDSLKNVTKRNLGPNINTQYSEIIPYISADGQTLYFVRNGDPENFGEDKNNDDIWYSNRINDSTWAKAVNIGEPLNNAYSNSVIFVSPDNNTMILNGVYDMFGNFLTSKGISVSHRQKDGSWSVPQKIEIEDFKNDWQYQNFTLSSDMSVLIMAVERPDDTYGRSDLYVSFRKPDGSYSKPKNMGPDINTQGSEGTPALAPDGVTLYFNSDGHPGYGDKDIFVTKRLDDTWTSWAEPLNLGPVINSPKFDAYFTVDAQGKYAYFVSSTDTYGEEDIFTIKLKSDAKPEPVVIIYGKVYDSKTKEPLYAKITYTDLETGKNIDVAISNPQTGEYKIVLPYGKKYSFYASKKGYISLSDKLDLSQISEYKEIERNLYLVPLEKGENIVLNNVYFPKGSAELLPSSYSELDRLVNIMKDNPTLKIEVSGHTNNIGDRNKLIELSLKRAQAVKDYLVSKGISEKRIKVVGYGPDKPVATNETESGRKKNQRVEFKIIEK